MAGTETADPEVESVPGGETGTVVPQQTATNTTTSTAGDSPPGGEGGNFIIHGLIGLQPGGFSETIRNSIQGSILRTAVREKEIEGKEDALEVVKSNSARTSINSIHTTESDTEAEDEVNLDDEEKNSIALHGLRKPRIRPAHNLLNLPPEILLLILGHTPFADIIRLRQTCKFIRAFASPAQIRTLLGPEVVSQQLHNHCKTCLLYDPFGRQLLLSPLSEQGGHPLSNQCHDCALRRNDSRIKVGKKVCLADHEAVWVCRWCGYPISQAAAYGHEQFHRECYRGYNDALFFFFVLGFLQLFLGIVAGALAWKYFRKNVLVFAPSVASFVLLWLCLGFIIFRGNRRRTYHWTFSLELIILGLWILPVYSIASEIAKHPEDDVPRSTQASLAMFGLNILFRLLNLLGNVILVFKPDLTRRRRPDVTAVKRAWYKVVCSLVFWTYPQSLEQKHPPDYL
ncbi:hypothetical protein QBC43DRAFT_293753 [Cladorrhinum sp. PSN259]|nr:hypothetical protein QBC43DRAFT_293753 [Cladorrhinum sp. PSN259]